MKKLVATNVAALCLLSIAALAQTPASTRSANETQWYAVFMQEAKIGYAMHQRAVKGQEVTHSNVFKLVLNRETVSLPVSLSLDTVETLDGKPLRFSQTTVLGPMGGSKKSGVIQNGKITLTTEEMGESATSTVAYPKDALMPEGATIFQKKMGLKPGTKYSYAEFDPDSMKALKHDIVVESAQSVPLLDGMHKLSPLQDTLDQGGQKMNVRLYVDSAYVSRKFELPMLGSKIVMIGCSEKYAKGPNGKLDIMKIGSVACPTAIANARQSTRGTFQLKVIDATMTLDFPVTDSQAVKKNSDGSYTITTELVKPGHSPRPYAGEDPAALEALKSGQYIQSDSPVIQAKAKEIVEGKADAYAAAKAIETWVSGYIDKKDLAVGYASALETLKTKAGDCTEHAVLVAALCRAAGIPCRLVVGVAYAQEFQGLKQRFIGHAWNQVYVEGKWVDIDAALGADACRITLGAAGDEPSGFLAMLTTLGNFQIVKAEAK